MNVTTRLPIALSLLALAGCRDFTACSGRRLLDDHTLSARSTPAITDAEMSAGSYVSVDADLAFLEEDLRDLGGIARVKSTVEAHLRGVAEHFDPRDPSQFAGGPETVGHADMERIGDPFAIATLQAELRALCDTPLLDGRLPSSVCSPFDLSQLDAVPMDDLTLTVDSDAIEVFWDAPRTNFDRLTPAGGSGSCDAKDDGTLEVRCKGGTSCAKDDAGNDVAGACVWSHPCETDADCRERDFLEPGVCSASDGQCAEFVDFDERESEHDREAPVLVVRLPLEGDFDPDDIVGTIIDIDISRVVFDLRFQPVPCRGGGCRHRGDRIFEGYRSSEPVDAQESDAGLDVHVRSTLHEKQFSISPGFACFLPFNTPLAIAVATRIDFPIGGGSVTCTALLAHAHSAFPPAIDRMGTLPGSIINGVIALPNLAVDVPGLGALDLSAVQVTNALRPFAARDGAWTDETVRILATGGSIRRGVVDLSRIRASCVAACDETGPDANAFVCNACEGICGGPVPTCDFTRRPICIENEAFCQEGDYRLTEVGWLLLWPQISADATCDDAPVAAARAPCTGPVETCDTDGDGLVGTNDPNPSNPDTDGDGFCDGGVGIRGVCERGEDLDGDGAIVVDSALPVNDRESDALDPCEPRRQRSLALRDAVWRQLTVPLPPSPNAAALIDGLLGFGVLAQGIFTRPLDQLEHEERFHYTDAWYCPSPACETPGAVFEFTGDADLDGWPDDEDTCPLFADPEQTDSDSDTRGDACDACPWTPQTVFFSRNDCTCDIDGDGCVNPLGLPPVPHAPIDVPRSCPLPAGHIVDRNPLRSDAADLDEDGIPNDCDPDRDGDGVPDEDDNCPDVANPDQRDQNGDGVGDACDLCNAGQPICHFEPDADLDFAPIDLGFGDLPWECLRDGPGCFGLLQRLCPAGAGGDCLGGGLRFDISGQPLSLEAADVGAAGVRAAVLLPDLTGDQLPEVAAVFVFDGYAELSAVDLASGEVLWSVLHQDPGFGAALIAGPDGGVLVSATDQGVVYGFSAAGELELEIFGAPGFGEHLALGADALFASTASGTASFVDGQHVGELQGVRGPVAVLGDHLVVGGDNELAIVQTEGAQLVGVVGVASGEELFGAGAGLGAFVSGAVAGPAGPYVVVGAPGAFGGAGSFATFDLSLGLAPSGWVGVEGAALGSGVSSVGDLDGDGFGEIAIGLQASLPEAPFAGSYVLMQRAP